MAIARAFFDESGTHGSEKNLCVAGYVFEGGADEQFDSEWGKMLAKYGLTYHHMREFASSDEGVYKHLSRKDREASLREAIAIIPRYASCGFAFSIEKASQAEIVKDSPWTNGYAFLTHQAFFGVERLLRGREQGLVNFFYEAGAEGWDEALKVFDEVRADPELEYQFRLGTFEAVGKSKATQLQAADLLSWSWLRERRRVDNGEKLGRNEEFRSLMNLPIDMHHWDAEAVEARQWIKHMSADDAGFIEWVDAADPRGGFLRLLKRAGPIAIDYFREVYAGERTRIIRTKRR